MKPLLLNQKLTRIFGSQGWWPILEKRRGKWQSVYKKRKQLNSSQMFEIAVGAILTQNAAWKNAEQALANLKQSGLLNPQKIINSPASRIKKWIRPSGYFNQKTIKLTKFCRWLINNYQGNLKYFFNKPLLICRQELLNLYGLGPETADSILLYAGRKPIFVVDAYTRRLLKLFQINYKDYNSYRLWFERGLPRNPILYGEFHAQIVAWGKYYRNKPALAARLIKSKLLHPVKGLR